MQQQTFDWVRGRRRTWIERVILPPFERIDADGQTRIVRTARMKYLLRVLESFARDGGPCFLKEATIAQAMGQSIKTVSRAIADCEYRGLLKVDRSYYKGNASRYEIIWTELAQAIIDHPETAHLIDMSPAAQAPGNVSFTPDKLSATPDNLGLTPDKLSVTPDKLSAPSAVHTLYRAGALKPSLNHERKPEIKPMYGDGDKKASFEGGKGGWPFEIQKEHLSNREDVQRLFEHAIARNYVSQNDRLRFFALAKWVAGRARRGELMRPGGLFTSQLRKSKLSGDWPGSRADQDAAMKAILQLDGRDGYTPEASDRVEQQKEHLRQWAEARGKVT